MGYHHIDPRGVEPAPDRPCVKRGVSDAVGLEHVAVNLYEVEPGEPQRAYSPDGADGTARVVAIGAPRTDDVHAYEP